MATYKNIFWRSDVAMKDGKRFANIHLLSGYTERSISDYQAMAAEMQRSFPQVTDKEVRCGVVTQSTYCNGYSVLTYNAYIEEGDYPGWRQSTYSDGKGGPDYSWT